MGSCFSKRKYLYTIVSYNIYSVGQYFNDRLDGIINAITNNQKYFPEIICLQETNNIFIQQFINKAKNKNIDYYCYSTKTYYNNNKLLNNFEKIELNDELEKYGYIAILSIWEIYNEDKIYFNDEWIHNGIIKVKLNSKKDINEDIILYNIHAMGESFECNKTDINNKIIQRISELKYLESNILEEYNKNKNNLIYICGDFNTDLNDKTTLEYNHMPIQFNPNFIDCWEYLNINNNTKLGNLGFTEDEETNQYRASIKIKSSFERKRVRFDGIFIYTTYINLPIKSMKLIGNRPLNIKKIISGKDTLGNNYNKYNNLFPSDHYGIKLVCIKNNI